MSYDYICLECGNPLGEERVYEYTEDYGEHCRVSPCCHSSIDCASQCIDCEEYFPKHEMYGMRCETCHMKDEGDLLECDLCEQLVYCTEIENGICFNCQEKLLVLKKHLPKFMQVAHC